MNYKVLVNRDLGISGTYLQGSVSTTYAQLVEIFGEPSCKAEDGYGDGKVTTEWVLNLNGDAITIYDWKEYGIPREKITDWHLGSRSANTIIALKHYLENDYPEFAEKIRI